MPLLLTYGDSNTYGALPVEVEGEGKRLGPKDRWPGVVRGNSEGEWTVIEEGLPGRTTRHPDPEMGPHMDGIVGLFIALQSHGPIDFLTIMLGTNDLKHQFDVTPQEIAGDIGLLMDIAISEEMQDRHGGFEVLLICPPPILEQGVFADQFTGGREKSLILSDLYREQADERGIDFLDAGSVIESGGDGIHFGKDEHRKLGLAVAETLKVMADNSSF